MDSTSSPNKQNLTLKRITGVLWFFLCLFGVLAALGGLFKMSNSPNWELFLQLGIIGEAAGLIFMGALQLGQAIMLEDEPTLRRFKRAVGFFLGITGGVSILGLFFAILKYPNAQMFLEIGLTGAVVTLAVIGLLTLGEVFTMGTPDGEADGEMGGVGEKRPSSIG